MPDSKPRPATVKPPPAATTKPRADAPPPKEPSKETRGRPPVLQKQLEEMFMALGMGAAVIGDSFDGEVIAENSHELAESWYKLAQQNAAVKKALEAMMQTGAWSGVVMVTAAVAVPILQNHGAIPADIPHPFRKPPAIAINADTRVPGMTPVPPQQGSPVRPSAARVPPEPPPGQHRHGS